MDGGLSEEQAFFGIGKEKKKKGDNKSFWPEITLSSGYMEDFHSFSQSTSIHLFQSNCKKKHCHLDYIFCCLSGLLGRNRE